jgi:predicted RNA polymerase sigma factor
LQAAIAAEHDRGASYATTDWAEIVRLYDLLLSVRPSAAASLARAVAVAEADGTAAGLLALDELAPDSRWHAVRGDLLARAGRLDEAIAATTASLDSDVSAPERRYRERQIAQWAAH